MPTTLIIGGNGGVARRLASLLVSQSPPHKVFSVIRKPEQSSTIESLGAMPIVQSLEDSSVDELKSTITSSGADAVVFSAGAKLAARRRALCA